MSNYENRKLLDLAYELPCQINIPEICQGGIASEPAHSNQQEHGKGKSIKAHDCFFAAGCRACHREIDQGNKYPREQLRDFWRRGFERTVLLLWERGLIKVAK